MASFWKVFRLIFVVFSLYLMGDAFYRWDGFRYYAPFSDFVPSVALISLLWSITALPAALLVWSTGKLLEVSPLFKSRNISADDLLVFLEMFIMLGALAWIGKQRFIPYDTSFQVKSLVILCIFILSFVITWTLHNRSRRWIAAVQRNITPLVWIFGVFVPLVVYHAGWIQRSEIPGLPGQHAGTNMKRPNIILVIFDALTARDMSLYGYHRKTTPFLDTWAGKASLFTNVQAAGNITTPTTASLMTGKRLWTHQTYQVAGSSKPVKGAIENLPLVLKNNGYFTMAFVVNHYASVKTLGIRDSFHIAPDITVFRSYTGFRGFLERTLYKLFSDKIRLHDWLIKRDFILYRFLSTINPDFSVTEVP
ncbi:MAG: sulfatase-like hydrolase/transferase, partial [Planctomycetota bacterium]